LEFSDLPCARAFRLAGGERGSREEKPPLWTTGTFLYFLVLFCTFLHQTTPERLKAKQDYRTTDYGTTDLTDTERGQARARAGGAAPGARATRAWMPYLSI